MLKNGKHLNRFRKDHPLLGKSPKDSLYGYFVVKFAGAELRIISSGNKGDDPRNTWEHVSVSLVDRCPTWDEMCHVKGLFWEPCETVLQFHPTALVYVNFFTYCLHLWKKTGVNHELPPQWMVGPTEFGIEKLRVV